MMFQARYVQPTKGTRMHQRGIGWAVEQLQNGNRVCRQGWNGKNMYLQLQTPDEHSKMTFPYVYMRTAQGDLVPWVCSQTDLLAMDWDVPERDQ